MANLFNGFYISHVSHFQNTKADTLAALAATLALPIDATYYLMMAAWLLFCLKHVLKTNEVHATSTGFEPRDWRFPIVDYALHDILSDDPKEAVSIRRRSLHFYYDLIVKTLYCRSYEGNLLLAYLTLKHKKCLKRHTMVYAGLINQVRNSRIDCTDSVIIGQPW